MEIEYRGWRIVETETETDQECCGFRMGRSFAVVDEFDEPAPVLQNKFWSPTDAMLMIDFICEFKKDRNWPTTMTYELNEATCYRRNYVEVVTTLKRLRTILNDCQEMGDDPTQPIRDALTLLHQRSVGERGGATG